MTLAGMAGLSSISAAASPMMGIASQLLGIKTPGQVITGVLNSRTVEDRIIERFQLMDLYSAQHIEHARRTLDNNTDIVESRKAAFIAATVEGQES